MTKLRTLLANLQAVPNRERQFSKLRVPASANLRLHIFYIGAD